MLKTTLSGPTMLAFEYAFKTSAGLFQSARSSSWNHASSADLTAFWSLLPFSISTNCRRVFRAMTLTAESQATWYDYTLVPKMGTAQWVATSADSVL